MVCCRCGNYVGTLGTKRYLPPPYPIGLDRLTPEDEAGVLVGFEAHLIGRMRQGNFRISHPQVGGRCSTFREWSESDPDDGGESVEGN